MAESKTECSICGASILQSTADYRQAEAAYVDVLAQQESSVVAEQPTAAAPNGIQVEDVDIFHGEPNERDHKFMRMAIEMAESA